MPKVLIVCAHRPHRSPSQRYRFEQYLTFLGQNGFSFSWSYLLDEKDDRIFYSKGNLLSKALILWRSVLKRKRDSRRFKGYDVIFIQREALFTGSSKYEQTAFESGAKVIFDFDDSIWMGDTSPGNKKWEWLKRPEKFFDNIKHAHYVIAGNEYLAAKAGSVNKNTVIIPTTIDTSLHLPKHELRNKETVCIGWSGSISTIKHFEILLPVLKQLKEKYKNKVRFKILGQETYENPELSIECIKWTEDTEVDQLNTFDIGLMPLPDDEWANGKCGLKGLSYMACGVTTIMSHVGVNKQIISHGVNGFLAGNGEEWLKIISELIEDPQLRKIIGEAGRQTVVEKYSVQANKNKYLRVFTDAAKSK
jgi:glycosyltransferase involved in cell wall biosynthesis